MPFRSGEARAVLGDDLRSARRERRAGYRDTDGGVLPWVKISRSTNLSTVATYGGLSRVGRIFLHGLGVTFGTYEFIEGSDYLIHKLVEQL